MRGYDGSGADYNPDYDHDYGYDYSCDSEDDYESDGDGDGDGMEELHRDGRQQLDTAWNELLQAHGYNPNETVTDEHWVEYWNLAWHICERKSISSDHLPCPGSGERTAVSRGAFCNRGLEHSWKRA
jgi:hypothetical protein